MTTNYLDNIKEIIEDLKSDNTKKNNINEKLIIKAYNLANDAHKNVLRKSGAPYIEHPVQVSEILSELKVDDITIIAALLHDVVEDTDITIEEIEEQFGKQVALIVEGVTKINEIKFDSLEHQQTENYRKLVVNMIKDLRVIIIKLADRLHNMRTIEFMTSEKQLQKAKETIEVYAPLANRLGMFKIKNELEDRSFKIINPNEFEEIKKRLTTPIEKMQSYVNNIKPGLQRKLHDYKIDSVVNGRVKHFYSIYTKMKQRDKTFDEIHDIIAIRIILISNEEADCYRALSIVHNFLKPVPGMMTDYIAAPKINGYKSLHTKVIFQGKILEIQIRTKEMHDIAEFGLAAHWKYKETSTESNKSIESNIAIGGYIKRLKTLLDTSFDNNSNPKEILEELRLNLTSGEVFVFTPTQKLVVLPRGATPVDFAYYLHEQIGNQCIAAKISGKIVPLSTVLVNGNVIEIVTSKKQTPSLSWLKFTVLAKARSSIKKYYRKNQNTQTILLGKEIFSNELKKYKITPTDEIILEVANSFGHAEIDSFFNDIGKGLILPKNFIRKISPKNKNIGVFNKFIKVVTFTRKKSAIEINNIDKSKLNLATCCNPLPGDKILGEITKDKGILIHRTNCEKILNKEIKNKTVVMHWDSKKDEIFELDFKIIAEDRRSLLLGIVKIIDDAGIDLVKLELDSTDSLVVGKFKMKIRNLNQYVKVRNKISRLKGVIRAGRNVKI